MQMLKLLPRKERRSDRKPLLCPCRLHRGDVVARMVTELINSGQVDVVCACFQGLHQMGHDRALARVSLTIAKMGHPDIIAAVSHHACSRNRVITPVLVETASNKSKGYIRKFFFMCPSTKAAMHVGAA